MNAAMIAQLLIAFGPSAINLIQELAAIWHKQSLTLDEVNAICAVAQKDLYDGIIPGKLPPGVV